MVSPPCWIDPLGSVNPRRELGRPDREDGEVPRAGAAYSGSRMDPHRKRTIRFVVALTCALLLAGALAYTSFSSASEASTPSQLASGARVGKTYQLTGKVAE